MKKIISGITLLIVVLSVASCGASRKYGCPSVAKISNTQFIKA
jgi:hypothetical protein